MRVTAKLAVFSSFPQRGKEEKKQLTFTQKKVRGMCQTATVFFLFFALVINLTASFHNVARTSVLFSSEISYSVAWQRPISWMRGRVLLAQAESR